jgi:hypothetical protein
MSGGDKAFLGDIAAKGENPAAGLKKTTTAEKTWMPSADDIKADKQA